MQGIPLRNVRKEGEAASIAASGTFPMGDMSMGEMRDLVISVRATYNASATSGATLNVYYSPDGVLYDTVPYAYYNITLPSGGGTAQESAVIDAPSVGYLKFEVKNNDATYAATNVSVWSSFSRWGDVYLPEADKNRYRKGIEAQKSKG